MLGLYIAFMKKHKRKLDKRYNSMKNKKLPAPSVDTEFQLNNNNIDKAHKWLISLLNESPYHILTAKNPAIGKWTMTRLWRAWMGSTAEFMAKRGVNMLVINAQDKCIGERPFSAEDAHELFMTKYLSDENGIRLSMSKKGNDDKRQATRGERVHAMDQHQQWMIERGIPHLNPNDSDYMKAMQEQNK